MNENNNINIKNDDEKIISKIIDKNNIEYSINNQINKYPQDTIVNIMTNKEKTKIKDENIKSTILQTNNIKKDIFNEEENDKIENNNLYKKKNSMIFQIENYEETGKFSSFINISDKVKPFIYKPQKNNEYTSHAFNNFHFLDIANKYKMIINIIIDDDSLQSSLNLFKIYKSIILSLDSLNEINISNKDFLVCVYFQHFSKEETFKQIFIDLDFFETINKTKKLDTFCCSYGTVLSFIETSINTLFFYKESSSFVEIYKFFFCNVLNDLITIINADAKEIGKTFLVVNWPNGKYYEETTNKYHKSRILSNIFRISNNRNMILIPDINYHPFNKEDYFGYINKYNFDADKVSVNLIWDMMCAYPIDHRYFYINMNYNLYLIFKEYYQNNIINIYSNEYYHDYNLSIYLQKKTKNVVIQKFQQVKIEYTDLPLNLLDIFFDMILKRGSEMANGLKLISFFFNFRNLTCIKFIQKFVILFKLICFLAEFFWLGLSLLISYAIFNEVFGSDDNNLDYFFSVGYAIIVILLILISSVYIKNNPKIKLNKSKRNIKRNQESYCILLSLYIVHYIFNIFFFVCCIIAVIKVSKGKYEDINDKDYYIFKKEYSIYLLILNIFFALFPNFIRASNLTTKGFFYYLILQFPNSACFFHVPYLFLCTRNINPEIKSTESLYISLYLLLNGIFTVICIVFDTKRQRRMDFFYVISTVLLVINGLKIIILISGCCWQNRFNRKISSGQIPQYDFTSAEINNNSNDSRKIDVEKNIKIKLNKEREKIRINMKKEFSSQIDIKKQNDSSLMKEGINSN